MRTVAWSLMKKAFTVKLAEAERRLLEEVVATGSGAARKLARARILLKADQGDEGPGWTDERIAEALDVSRTTVERVRKQYARAGLDGALARKRPPPRLRKVDGAGEAHLIAAACSTPPDGHKRWTLRLLAGTLVELEQVDAISHETVRQMLKKRAQAVAEERLVHPAQSQCPVCLPDGGRARCVHAPLRPPAAPALPGRSQQATAGRHPGAAARAAGVGGQGRSRVRTPRHGGAVHGQRAPRRPAPCPRPRSAHGRRLGARH